MDHHDLVIKSNLKVSIKKLENNWLVEASEIFTLFPHPKTLVLIEISGECSLAVFILLAHHKFYPTIFPPQ